MKREKNPNQKAFKIVNKKAPVILPKPSVEEVGANIGSEENVSFAMSIALQMKDKQHKADEAKKSEVIERSAHVGIRPPDTQPTPQPTSLQHSS